MNPVHDDDDDDHGDDADDHVDRDSVDEHDDGDDGDDDEEDADDPVDNDAVDEPDDGEDDAEEEEDADDHVDHDSVDDHDDGDDGDDGGDDDDDDADAHDDAYHEWRCIMCTGESGHQVHQRAQIKCTGEAVTSASYTAFKCFCPEKNVYANQKHRNPLELHKASAPELSGTFRNFTEYLHRNPPEPQHGICTGTLQNPREPCPEPGVEAAPDRTGV